MIPEKQIWSRLHGLQKSSLAHSAPAQIYCNGRCDEHDRKKESLAVSESQDKGIAGGAESISAGLRKRSGIRLKLVCLGAANHDIDVLLVSSWNRLGRALSEVIDTMAYLKEQNVTVQSVKEEDISLDQALSFARFAAAMQIPDEALPEDTDVALSEDLEESEGFDMTQSF